jgi:hypothetical protein
MTPTRNNKFRATSACSSASGAPPYGSITVSQNSDTDRRAGPWQDTVP